MDEWGRKHFQDWWEHQFPDGGNDAIRTAMIARYADDSEYWERQSYWDLLDAVKRDMAECATCGMSESATVHRVGTYRRVSGGYGHPFVARR